MKAGEKKDNNTPPEIYYNRADWYSTESRLLARLHQILNKTSI